MCYVWESCNKKYLTCCFVWRNVCDGGYSFWKHTIWMNEHVVVSSLMVLLLLLLCNREDNVVCVYVWMSIERAYIQWKADKCTNRRRMRFIGEMYINDKSLCTYVCVSYGHYIIHTKYIWSNNLSSLGTIYNSTLLYHDVILAVFYYIFRLVSVYK